MTVESNRKKSSIREWTIVIAFVLFVSTVGILKEVKKTLACRAVKSVEQRVVPKE